MSTEEILRKLRDLRVEKQMRQEHLARKLGIDRTTYIKKEKGYIPITTDEWLGLAAALDEDVSYFFASDNKAADKASQERLIGDKERFLIKLYRSLSRQEQEDLLSCIRLLLKGIKRKKVVDTLGMLFNT